MASHRGQRGAAKTTKPQANGRAPGSASINYAELITRSTAHNVKINVSSSFLTEMLAAVYFCLFNDVSNEGLQALNEIHARASYCLYGDVLIVS